MYPLYFGRLTKPTMKIANLLHVLLVTLLAFCLLLGPQMLSAQQRRPNVHFFGRYASTGSIDQPVTQLLPGLAILADSTLATWGINLTPYSNYTPKLNKIIDVAYSYPSAIALRADGKLFAWGEAQYLPPFSLPADLDSIVAISSSGKLLALKSDSTIVTVPSAISDSIAATLRGVVNICAAEQDFYFAILKSGQIVKWGDQRNYPNPAPVLTKKVKKISRNRLAFYFLNQDSTITVWPIALRQAYDLPASFNSIISMAAFGDSSLIAVKADGTIAYQNINNPQYISFIAQQANAKAVFQYLSSFAISTQSTHIASPTLPTHAFPSGLYNIDTCTTLGTQFVGIKKDSTLAVWGIGDREAIPPPPLSTKVVQVSGGASHCAAIKADSTVIAWGDTTFGKCNLPFGLTQVVKISAGANHTLALRRNGTLVAWGSNENNVCTIPAAVQGRRIIAISAGSTHNIAMTDDSVLLGWGSNRNGQLDSLLSGSSIKRFFADNSTTLVLLKSGKIRVRGLNNYGFPFARPNSGISKDLLAHDGLAAQRGSNNYWNLNYYEPTSTFNAPGFKAKALSINYNLCAYVEDDEHEPNKTISGKIIFNINPTCNQDSLSRAIGGNIVQIGPDQQYMFAETDGNYSFQVDSGQYQVSQVVSQDQSLLQRQLCPPSFGAHTANFAAGQDVISGLDFINQTVACPRLGINMVVNRRRRCARSSTIIEYSNTGYAKQANVQVQFRLPRYLRLISASRPYVLNPQDSIYTISLGTLLPNTRGQITLIDSVACLANIRGLEQCTEAWILPGINSCQFPPNFDGSNIVATSFCKNDTSRLILKNMGGTMRNPRAYKVYADSILIRTALYRLAARDSIILTIPTRSFATNYRLEAELDSASPYGYLVFANISCGQRPVFSGFGSYFGNPVAASDCQPIRDSYDPNDKQVQPKGQGLAGNIEPGTWLSYKIRFINKGNDTAYMVRIADTLSSNLDLGSLQLGPASHSFTPSLSGKGQPVLSWQASGINLPDSARSGQAAASGFVSFRIRTKSLDPIGTQIKNHADIYFDFNDPVRTNTVLNTLFRPSVVPGVIDTIIITAGKPSAKPTPTFTIQPNPGLASLPLVAPLADSSKSYRPMASTAPPK